MKTGFHVESCRFWAIKRKQDGEIREEEEERGEIEEEISDVCVHDGPRSTHI